MSSFNPFQKGNNPPSGPSGCTNVPNKSGGSCPTISSKNFAGAGHVHVEAPTVNFHKGSTHNAAARFPASFSSKKSGRRSMVKDSRHRTSISSKRKQSNFWTFRVHKHTKPRWSILPTNLTTGNSPAGGAPVKVPVVNFQTAACISITIFGVCTYSIVSLMDSFLSSKTS
ncbi:hypothetical protein NE237_011524 [Protea cynaroides]|uniref:Uncharacterized protein n=1 Tax=Protea cynaroides TaxID=273540 RepID=A0A9Q0GV44_9MAGN|nr:hypothetical protein NE237_011524 [Protea cynaroides]